MNKLYNLLATCLLLCSAWLLPMTAKATHAAGGEILYEWVSDSTYRFYYKFYRDCNFNGSVTALEPDSIPLCFHNTCNSFIGSATLKKIGALPNGAPNGSEIIQSCASYPSGCAQPYSPLHGYKEWWYNGLVTLSSRCDSWIFQYGETARNAAINNLTNPSSQNMYVEATLNNSDVQDNTSPFFSVKPVPELCDNLPYVYDNGVYEKDNDSLYFDVIQPRTGGYNIFDVLSHLASCDFSVADIRFSDTMYNLVNNPIATNRTFSLDHATGKMSFTPNRIQCGVLSMAVAEYRKGKKIGSVMRDIQFYVVTCSSSLKDAVQIDSAFIVNGRAQVCTGDSIAFCYNVASTSNSATLISTDDNNTSLPGAAITYTGVATDSVKACVIWKPTVNDTGLHNLVFTTNDTTCTPPGVRLSTTRTIPIYVCYNPVGIANTAITNKSVHIYPNPANNMVHVTASVPIQVSIRSIDGREVLHVTNGGDIDISNLANGLYIVQVADEHGVPLQVEKLVKNK